MPAIRTTVLSFLVIFSAENAMGNPVVKDGGVDSGARIQFDKECSVDQRTAAEIIVRATKQGNSKLLSDYTDNAAGYLMFWSSVARPVDLKFRVFCEKREPDGFTLADAVVGGMNTCVVARSGRIPAHWKIVDCTFNDGN